MSEGNEDALACSNISSSYFVVDMEFNVQEIEDEIELEKTIIHELLHIIVEPLSEAVECGLGKKFAAMSTSLTESTIERLVPGYLYLHNKAFRKNKNTTTNK